MSDESTSFANNLLSQMTLDEKIGQLHQYFSWGNFDPEVVRKGKAGSVINASGALSGQGFSGSGSAQISNHIQQLAMESRLKIPQILGRDVIHGYRTIFPIPLAQSAAFDISLAEQAASIAAKEASADGVKWTFAPMLDIARDPRWGRVAEGNGEDPYLGSQLAAAVIKGFQGTDYSAADRIVACAKHYVGYGSAEGGRDYDNGEISELTLRDIYLPPFHSAVKAGVGTLMSAFLDLNGVPATANRKLLTDVLRGEWGFDGFVVSDWDSVVELINHGVAENESEAAELAFHAGVDMEMVSRTYPNTLAFNLQNGKISLEEIDEGVRRILRIKHRAGLFANPFTDLARSSRDILTPNSRALARKFAQDTIVLLKNKDNILPLKNHCKVLVGGYFIHATAELFGTWTPDGNPADVQPFSTAFSENAPRDFELHFADNTDLALAIAQESDLVILTLGENPRRSGENSNVSDLSLPPGQAEFVDQMIALGKPVIMVIFAGRPLAIGRQVSQADAVLYAWHPGIEGAAAIADIIFGRVSPSARLPITFPRATGQVPIYYNHKNSGRPVSPDGPFRTRYVDLPASPLFPFGFGLTYTNFDYAKIALSSESLRNQLRVSADITNTGQTAGVEVVQLYVRDLVGSVTRPIRELKNYQKIFLKPGESRRVSFIITEEDLAFTHLDGSFSVEPGKFEVWIAPDSSSGINATFRI